MNKQKLKIFITGGTIDNIEYANEKEAPKNPHSLIPALLKQARLAVDYDYEILIQKDSRFVTASDRELILKKCKNSKEEKIIISHGTFTMPVTAKYLGKKNLNKTIVLFGSHIPANKDNSDALFNLGTAIVACQLLPQGVFITMNGRVFTWDNVRKELPTGYFKEE
jgi:L-asparaginase